MLRRIILAGSSGIGLFLAQVSTAHAHESWFVTGGTHAGAGFTFDLTIGLVIMATLALIATAVVIENMSGAERWRLLAQKIERLLPKGAEWRVLGALVSVMLIANAITGVFLAPTLVPDGGFAPVAMVAQVVIGLVLLSQVLYSLAGALVLVAIPLALVFFPFNSLIDYVFEYLTVGVTFIFVGLSACPDQLFCRLAKVDRQRYTNLALTTARIGGGLTFAVLTLHNKLLDPNMALTFLDSYPLNFMPALGFSNFTNLHFVFATGIVELTIGMLLITGIATRFVGVMLTGLLFTTLIVLGPTELIGHLPIIGLALLFAYRGAGPYRLALPRLARPAPAQQVA